ncbi:hypothetical protein ACH4UM_29480 [Streptomyces sp. NPDC020801]|uniref:hypothetical protein n=1 Tax=unclassified Streptomyces TaxID=2593676 RepID=UPI0037952D24
MVQAKPDGKMERETVATLFDHFHSVLFQMADNPDLELRRSTPESEQKGIEP